VGGARLGGAAADFVGGLGRKVAELRAVLESLADAPERERGRNELRRKLHALGVGARLLHFGVLAQAIADATRRIDEEASQGRVSEGLLDELSGLLGRIPDLAWSKTAPTPTPPPAEEDEPLPVAAPPPTPWTVLVVGAESLALALEDDLAHFPCEVERTGEVKSALETTRTVAPELIVVDADLEGVYGLVETLIDDPLTGPVPIIAVGTFADPAQSSRLVALGVARAVQKPATASTLRELAAEVLGDAIVASTAGLHPELGELSVTQLADRLAEEVRHALVAEAEAHGRDVKVPLGIGAEVLGPMWGALARVRDVVRARSKGAVSFREERARRPIAVASALTTEDSDGNDRGASRGKFDVDLDGRIIVVADDDPAVVWFVSDVLRSAGAKVLEARDGGEALVHARHSAADAIVSDVLMPRVDGLTLARSLRRDVALRDRPVVLLSWKEDLLKRLRDLRMDSHAMLRKEADGRTIVARMREVMAPRVRVEARIATASEVRGRLDDLTVTSLLQLTNRVRQEACVVVRDAANVFEVELQEGGIRRLSRTGVDGSFARGPVVLPGLLGVMGGRFLVRALPTKRGNDAMSGELDVQLAPVLRRIRSACDAISGANTIDVSELTLEPELLDAYLSATPPPVRMVLERIVAGASPRMMILDSEIAPATLEDILLDVASRGIVVRAIGARGEDMLAQAERALDEPPAPMVRSTITQSQPPPKRISTRPPAKPETAMVDFSLASLAPPPLDPIPDKQDEDEPPPQSLDTVLRTATEGEDHSPSKPPIIDARELKPRSVRSEPPVSAVATPRPPSNPPSGIRETTDQAKAGAMARKQTLHGVGPGGVLTPLNTAVVADTMPPPSRISQTSLEAKDAAESEPKPESDRAAPDDDTNPAGKRPAAVMRTEPKPAPPQLPTPTPPPLKVVIEETPPPSDRSPPSSRRRNSDADTPSDRPSYRKIRPRHTPVPPASQRKAEDPSSAFWWIVLAIAAMGLALTWYVQKHQPEPPANPSPSSSVGR